MHGPAKRRIRLAAAAPLLALAYGLLAPGVAMARYVSDDALVLSESMSDAGITCMAYAMITIGSLGLLAHLVAKITGDTSDLSPDGAIWVSDSFDLLKAEDPDFAEETFFSRVGEMFTLVQNALELGDTEPTRQFLSKKQFQTLEDAASQNAKRGHIDTADIARAEHITVVLTWRKNESHFVKVMIAAEVLTPGVGAQTQDPAADGQRASAANEFWILQRPVSAQGRKQTLVHKCPHCGAPGTDGDYVRCGYCGALMNDPALDWKVRVIQPPIGSTRRSRANQPQVTPEPLASTTHPA